MLRVPVTIRRDLAYSVILLALFAATPPMVDALCNPEQQEPQAQPAVVAERLAAAQAAVVPTEPPEEAQDEAEQIDAALVAQGYFRDDVPLSYEEQDYLHTACEEFGVDYELALGVIQRETQFDNRVGDDGASEGYMQVQEKWHRDRMATLGVTDLMDPASNFRVGCSFLSELLDKYGNLQDALTYYNKGHTGQSSYSRDVIAYMEGWEHAAAS